MQELNKMKEALGEVDKSTDPTIGAGMNMDDVVNKLLKQAEDDGEISIEDVEEYNGEKQE